MFTFIKYFFHIFKKVSNKEFFFYYIIKIIVSSIIYNWLYIKFSESIFIDTNISLYYMLLMFCCYISINLINYILENVEEIYFKNYEKIFINESLKYINLDKINNGDKLEHIINKTKTYQIDFLNSFIELILKIVNLISIMYFSSHIPYFIIIIVLFINVLFYKFYGDKKTKDLYSKRIIINKNITNLNLVIRENYRKFDKNEIIRLISTLANQDIVLNKESRKYNFWMGTITDFCMTIGVIFFLYTSKNKSHIMPLIASLRNSCNFFSFCISFYTDYIRQVSNFDEFKSYMLY